MRLKQNTLVILLAALAAGLLAACSGPQETILTGEEQEAVLAFSEAKTDNLTAGMNAGDYAVFSQNFDQAMLDAMSRSAFEKFKKDTDDRLGAYVSRQVSQVAQSPSGEYVAVVYEAVFEKDDSVTMRVVFRADEPHQIGGLWFK